MGRGMAIFVAVVLGLTGLLFLLAQPTGMLWAAFLVFAAGMVLLYIFSDGVRAHAFRHAFGRIERWAFESWLGRLFRRQLGPRVALPEIGKHLAAERRERAVELAQRFGLVREAAELAAAHRGPEAAADFAAACGDPALAQQWYRTAYDIHRAAGQWTRAAEAAEQAGLYAEAMAAWGALPDHAGALRQARLSERSGHPREALEAYLTAGAAGDALRLSDRFGLLDALVEGAERRENPDLWRVAAEACAKAGRGPKSVDLWRRAGDLRQAVGVARRFGLEALAREVEVALAAQHEAHARAEARARGWQD